MILFGRRQIIERNYNIKKNNFNGCFFLSYCKYNTKDGGKVNNKSTEFNKEKFENKWKKIIKKDYVNRITNIFENNNTNEIKKNSFYFILGPKGVGKKFFIEKSKEIFLNREIQDNEEKKSINIKRKKYNEENMGYRTEVYMRKINVDGMNKVRKQNIFFEYDFKSKCENNVMPFSIVIYNLENYLRHELLKEMNNDIKNKNIKLEDIYKEIMNTNNNDIISLTKIKDFFKDVLNNKNKKNGANMYDYLSDIDKTTIENYIMLIETNKFSYDNLESFLNILLKRLNPNVFCSFLNEFSSFLYFLKLIAQYEEQLYYSRNSQNIITHYSNSGLYIYKYFFLLIKLLKNKYGYNFFFIFYNFNLLFIGPQPSQNFQFFYNFMDENLRKYNIPVIAHSIKNLEMMKTIFLYNNYVNNLFYKSPLNYGKNKNVPNSTNMKEINYSKMNYTIPPDKIANSSNNTEYYNDELKEIQKMISLNESENYEMIKNNIIEIENMSYDIIKFILMPNFVNKEEICKCLYEIIGGNIELIKIVCKGLYDLNSEFNEKKIWEEIEKEKKENITYDMDEEPDISLDNTTEEIIAYKKIEKQYNFLKNIHQNVLHTFILDFEKKIINFFSLPHIERMKENNNSYNVDENNNISKSTRKSKEDDFEKRGLNYVEFHFTIFEVIRYFIKKKKYFAKIF